MGVSLSTIEIELLSNNLYDQGAQLGRSWTVLIMLCNLNNLQLGIVTRWLEYLLNIWPFTPVKICPKVEKFPQILSHWNEVNQTLKAAKIATIAKNVSFERFSTTFKTPTPHALTKQRP